MENLETRLAALRAHADTLGNRLKAADTASLDAKARLQRHLLEPDLDADEKTRAKLEAAVSACALTHDGYADALAELQAQIADMEQKIAAERAAMERKQAAETLAFDLDEIERMLPDYLAMARRFADAWKAINFHFDAAQIGRFVRDGRSQVDVAAAFATQDLRAMVAAIRDGRAPIPAPKPRVAPVAAIEPAPPTETVFMIASDPAATFTVLDRSSEARTIKIAGPQF